MKITIVLKTLPRQQRLKSRLTKVSINVRSIFGYSPLGPAVGNTKPKFIYNMIYLTAIG